MSICLVSGYKVPFTKEKIKKLYPTRKEYIKKFKAVEYWSINADVSKLNNIDKKFGIHFVSKQGKKYARLDIKNKQEVDNIIEACNSIADKLFMGASQDMCIADIKEYNRLVLKRLPLEENIIPGEIRTYSVGVGRYRAAPHEDCEYLLGKLCDWLNADFKEPRDDLKIAFGIIKSIIAHLYFALIHPFGDGNGRVARLIEFQLLINSGIPSPAAHLLSNHYNATRAKYYKQLDQSSQSIDGEFSFIKYALEGFIDGLKEQFEEIKKQQLEVTWENYIHDMFRGKDSPANTRKRHLILDLSKVDGFVPMRKIREISPRIAAEYAQRNPKTLSRDIDQLSNMDLIEISKDGVRPKKEKILAFLPRRISN